ncbi:MAG: hypothetical protein K2O85_07510 [Helicobacter sp.]|nr:hypothetical protein [Helicobacter sp.]
MRWCYFCLCLGVLWAEWVMFSDSTDTYLYNNQTGEVYIRHKQGGLNYKDFFVRMPNGVIPENIQAPSLPQSSIKPLTGTSNDKDLNAAKRMVEEATKQMGNMLYQGQ